LDVVSEGFGEGESEDSTVAFKGPYFVRGTTIDITRINASFWISNRLR
jgi:hypothetical protein